MINSQATEPLTADDETIRTALNDAFLPALLPALAQATGDFSLLREDLRPPAAAPGMLQGGMSDEQQSQARDFAFDVLKTLRDDGANGGQRSIEDDVRRIFEWMTGSPAS
ncbi:MAG: hypothetical protein J4N98_02235, partial [Chloroflexi bacterium]|nr:hypothetical protein [Chloroflexota bacterium]